MMPRSELFMCKCRKCNKILEQKEDRYIVVLEERNNDVRTVYHKHRIIAHFHKDCLRV